MKRSFNFIFQDVNFAESFSPCWALCKSREGRVSVAVINASNLHSPRRVKNTSLSSPPQHTNPEREREGGIKKYQPLSLSSGRFAMHIR